MTLFDQTPLTPEPPVWAPATATVFGQATFDVGKAYTRIKELVMAQFGAQVGMYFQMAEGSVQGQVGTDLPTLLSSLGHVHSFVTLQPQIKAAEPAAAAAPAAPGTGHHPNAGPPAVQRIALVWQLADAPLWQKVFQIAGANMGGVAPVQEQGFTGWRFPGGNGMGPVGIFLNDKYLTVAIGPEVAEAVLSWLRSPPVGKDALRTSTVFERAKAILPLEPCLVYAVSNGALSSKSTREILSAAIDQWVQMQSRHGRHGPPNGDDDEDDDDAAPGAAKPAAAPAHHDPKAFAAKLKAILPTDDEVEGMLGVGVQQVLVKPQGIQLVGVVELPPAPAAK